jgi:hypothetical protein
MAYRKLHSGLLVLIAGTALVFSSAHAAHTNRPPTISGVPPTSVAAGSAYSFVPLASDPDRRQSLRFSISNKPAWASFSAWTGRLSGTPTAAHTGTTSGIVIRVSDGRLSTALPAFSITVTGGANRPPVIAGVPGTSAIVGTAYVFAPTASDPDGDALTWSITGKPAGASFSVSTGRLTWTPTAVGPSGSIVITVTDNRGAAVSLPAFSIAVSAATPPGGTAMLSWQAPTQYIDGSSLPASQLAAYRVYQGASAGSLVRVAEVDGLTLAFNVQSLPSGTHYFAVTAVTLAGAESALSAVGSKTIP